MNVSKKRLSRSPSASSLAFERATKRQKISNSSSNGNDPTRWRNKNNISTPSTQETEQRKKRLQQFYAITNLASSNDKSETLRKKTVFQANHNKQRNDVEIRLDLDKYMKKIDASKAKIQKDLQLRLHKKKLLKLKNKKKCHSTLDPLDAFMSALSDPSNPTQNPSKSPKKKQKAERIYNDESKFDEGDLLISDEFNYSHTDSKNKKEIKVIDHSQISYAAIRKNLYVESPEMSLTSWTDIALIRTDLLNHCKVVCRKGTDIKPILKWTQCGLSNNILAALAKFQYAKPFAVQCQAIPIIMSGRDLICVAQTGSGKTLAYILPLIRHILANGGQAPMERAYVCSIVLCPTRELAQQIYAECNKFMRMLDMAVVAVYGGVSISEQIGRLRKGCHVVIATPGRLIELLCINGGRLLDIKYVSYFVLDEADRLFDLGFQSQISAILQNVRPDKQLLMFSATFPKKIEKIARQYFLGDAEQNKSVENENKNNKKKKKKKKKEGNAMQMSIGSSMSAPCVNVAQFVYIVESAEEKFKSLLRLLSEWYGRGNILIFVDRRDSVDLLFGQLCDAGYFSLILHGGINQTDRDYTMTDFKNKVRSILICTSIASRGLDVSDLVVVINYFPPHHYEDYVHKIGRTGRANNRGVAYTFINRGNLQQELKCVPHIVRAMKRSSYLNSTEVSPELVALCRQYSEAVSCGGTDYEVQHRNAGYAGKGHKFDKSEENVKKCEIERQKYVYGKGEELNEWNLSNMDKADDVENITNASKKDKKMENDGIGNVSNCNVLPLSRDLEMLKKALLAAKKKKKEIWKKNAKKSKKNIEIMDEKTSSQLIQKTINRTIAKEKKKHEKQTRERVESIAKIISLEIENGETEQNGELTENGEENKNKNKKVQIFKLDINGYAANVRKAVSYKTTLNVIRENYNVQILQKGSFVGNGRKVGKGESALYLEIKGTNISEIHAAIKELKQILYREAQKTNNYRNHHKYHKYTVV